jgi:hypothetical protein
LISDGSIEGGRSVEGFNQERRGLFDGLKVPFDVKAILLAAVGILVFYVGVLGIETAWDLDPAASKVGLLTAMTANLTSRLGYPGIVIANMLQITNTKYTIHTGTWVFFFLWCAVVWSFFAGAICRIAAMKIAREESIELKDAVKFGFSKFFPNLLSIGFVVAIIGFFWLFCDATIAGGVGRIPYIGELLVAALFVLVLLSSFFIVFTGALGVLGFNLSAAAIATEASDTFDGVSRAWNYILARPWHVILTYGLTFGYLTIFLFFGNLFLKVSVHSLAVRWWGMSHEARVYPQAGQELATKLGGMSASDEARLPGKAEYLYNRIIKKDPNWTGNQILYPQTINGKTELRDVMPAIESTLWASGGVVWFWITLAQLMIYAYAVSYFLSSQTTVYFLLRKEVEGDDYTEINLEEDEEEDHAEFGEVGRAEPKPAAGPVKALPVVAGGPGAVGGEKKPDAPAGGAGDKHDHKH